MDPKATLHHYLRRQREALLAKTDGLSQYDLRRPLTPTATNLLGLVKHLTYVQAGYLGDCFGRPVPGLVAPWDLPDADDDADMHVLADEPTAQVLELWTRSCAHADATVEALPLDAVGEVPWWPPERRSLTLHTALVHLTVETARHVGHADIVRELVDGAVGLQPDNPNLPARPADDWAVYRTRVEQDARTAAGRV